MNPEDVRHSPPESAFEASGSKLSKTLPSALHLVALQQPSISFAILNDQYTRYIVYADTVDLSSCRILLSPWAFAHNAAVISLSKVCLTSLSLSAKVDSRAAIVASL
jgi:hypothetical protein